MELSQLGGGEFGDGRRGEGPQKAVCLLGGLFTFLRVILALGGGGVAGGPTCRWGLSVVDEPAGTVAAPGHVGGT